MALFSFIAVAWENILCLFTMYIPWCLFKSSYFMIIIIKLNNLYQDIICCFAKPSLEAAFEVPQIVHTGSIFEEPPFALLKGDSNVLLCTFRKMNNDIRSKSKVSTHFTTVRTVATWSRHWLH